MLRPSKTARLLLILPLILASFGCTTLYRPMYSPGKSNYKRPPESKESAVDLLPPDAHAGGDGGAGAAGLPLPPEGGGAELAPAPGMLDAAPAIPGLPQL